jgi:hypothetical protein
VEREREMMVALLCFKRVGGVVVGGTSGLANLPRPSFSICFRRASLSCVQGRGAVGACEEEREVRWN